MSVPAPASSAPALPAAVLATSSAVAPAAPRAPIPAADRIPFWQKTAFSLGSCTDHLATGITTAILFLPFFNLGLGLDPAKLGLILIAWRLWDAVTDPVMGHLSDNARTRWGRRRPFMVVGAVLTAAIYPLLWRVPAGLGETGTLVYLTLIGMVFFTTFTVWSMPYYGMQLELTPNYDERTRLTAGMALAGKFITLAGGWMMALVAGPWFADAATGRPDIVRGLQTSSWYIAAVILVLGLLPALFVKERYYEAEAAKQTPEPFWEGLRNSFRCAPLWNLIGVSFFVVFSSMSVGTLGQYINIYYINAGHLADASFIEGWKNTAMLVAGVLSIPFWSWVSERLDKRTVVALIVAGGILGHLLNWVCLRPGSPYLQLIPAVFQASVVASIWMFLPSMKADVADYDELQTGRRREGSMNAFYSWFIKAAFAASLGVGGLVLKLTGFSAAAGEQPPEVLSRMVALYLALPVVISLIALVFVFFYPLQRARMSAIRAQLEARRGAV